MANKTISSIPAGQSVTLTGTYKATESDMGKTDIVNTVTAKNTIVSAQASSAAATMEAVRYSFDATKTQTNTPADGEAFGEGETVIWDIKATNTGNQTLSGLKITENLTGALLPSGNTLTDIKPRGSATKQAQYTIESSDLIRGSVRNNVSISNDKAIQSSVYSPYAIVKNKLPQTQDEFRKLTWKEIKELARDCAENGKEKYKYMLGWSTTFTVNPSTWNVPNGQFNTQLVALNHGENNKSETIGFKFMTYFAITDRAHYSSTTTYPSWTTSEINLMLQTFSEAVADDLSGYLQTMKTLHHQNLKNRDSVYAVEEKMTIPELPEVVPSKAEYDHWWTLFDYYDVDVETANLRRKKHNSGWWTCTFSEGNLTTGYPYKAYSIGADGIMAVKDDNLIYGVIPVFGL